LLLLVGVAGIIFVIKSPQAQSRIQETFADSTQEGGRFRLYLAKSAIQMWQDHFWLGVGPAHFDYRFGAYRPVEVQARPGFVHNDYVNTLADWGTGGAILIATATLLLFFGVIKTWKFVRPEPSDLGVKQSNRSAFVFGATIGLVAIMVHSFSDFNMHIPANAILAVSLMALLSGHIRYATERYWIRPGVLGKILATLVGAAALFYLGKQGLGRAREYVWLDQAGRHRLTLQAKSESIRKIKDTESARTETLQEISNLTGRYLQALHRAISVEPMNPLTVYELAESLRLLSWQGQSDYQTLATEAMDWFRRGVLLNRYDAYNYMRIGMCLDHLGRHAEAAPFYEEAVKRDPNNYYVLAHQGWHFVQTGDYPEAKLFFERSIHIRWIDNPIAYSYLAIVERKLKEK